MILRIFLVVANTIIGWFWVCRNSQQHSNITTTSPRYAHRPPSTKLSTAGFTSYPKTHGPDHCSFSLVQTVDSFIFLGAPRRPCGVQPTVLDALICSFWKRANIIWMTIQLCGVHCHCFIHKAHNQAHWECANKCEGASKCVHDL